MDEDALAAIMEIVQQINDLSGGLLEALSGAGGAGPEGGGEAPAGPPEGEPPAPPA